MPPVRLARARTAARLGLLGAFAWESPRYFVTDPRGYAAVADHVANAFLEPLQSSAASDSGAGGAAGGERRAVGGRSALLFNKSVTHVFYEGREGVRVRTADGSEYRGRYAISTFSAGVVNEAIAHGTMFHPPLPAWKREAFGKAVNGIYTKIFLKYRTRFWHEGNTSRIGTHAAEALQSVGVNSQSLQLFGRSHSYMAASVCLQEMPHAVNSQCRRL